VLAESPHLSLPNLPDTPEVGVGRRPLTRPSAAQTLLAFSALMAGFVVFAFFLSSVSADRAQAGLERRFERPLSYGKAPVGGTVRAGTPVARLDIPKIGLHQIVVEGTSAAQLSHGPGHLAVSPLPGQAGNSVIAAHRLALGGAFARLSSLQRGARIELLTGQGHFTYIVKSRMAIPASDTAVFQATSVNQLTLVTSANLSATRRLAVIADLVGPAKPARPGRPSVLRPSEGGLVGNNGNLGQLAAWTALLLLIAALTVVVYRELPRWSAYLATTPMVLLVVWLVYTNLAQLLPATL
jgi:sortase A